VAEDAAFPYNRLGDVLWSVRGHRRAFGELPRLVRPRRFNEHLLRSKLTRDGRSALRARVSDKELVKAFVEERLGPGLTARTLAVLRTKDEVASFSFPPACAVKPTHASGLVLLRRAGEAPPEPAQILPWLALDYYREGREPNYRALEPKVIVEELLLDAEGEVPADYKAFCFRGTPAFLQVDVDRFSGHLRSFYSPRWRELDFGMLYPRELRPLDPPPQLAGLLAAARRLSEPFPFMRVDFYCVGGRLVVGELTSFPENCRGRFLPDRADHLAGRLFVDPIIDVEELFGLRRTA
jgi:hypothetical protein